MQPVVGPAYVSVVISVTAKTGQGDYESTLEQRARETQMEQDLRVVPRVAGGGDVGDEPPRRH